jgi:putative tryptophan/tyrosine transport system substrate-binding protein
MLLAAPLAAEAQQARLYRVGVILQGGPYSGAVDGLRKGLAELGLEEGKQFILHVREGKGDLKAVEQAAGNLEQEKVDLIYAVGTSVTLAVKRATKTVPIVFYAGSDPVSFGFVESFRKPGGRLTGVYSGFSSILTAKRLELLKEIVPSVRRVVMFYNPDNPVAERGMKEARDTARLLKVELVEHRVASVEELRAGLHVLRAGKADAFLSAVDALVVSQTALVIDVVREKKLPAMFSQRESVVQGGLASYGVSYEALGRLAARYVRRILLGTNPGDLPVEQVDRLYFVINLKTAKALGLTIPPSLVQRADEVLQ